mmetsp:Transcript_114914/g.321127  ORF Transcript_114914/g.321127 Transcript_114914/m.321127 type:complete len:376 (-) Transcript_114914:89-1216(-)
MQYAHLARACAGLAGFTASRSFASCENLKASAWSWTEKDRFAAIRDAEERLLSRMPGTRYRTEDIMVRVGAGRRCFFSAPQEEYHIRTVVVGEEHRDKPPIVLVHGFMMGGAAFFKWLPMLARERTVYAIDVIGMGGSGRPPFDARGIGAEEAERLLVEPFERWAEALGLREFDLVGHSFGGFVCAAWAARGAGVRRMGLLSPLLGFSDERISRLRPAEDTSWQRRAFLCLVETAWAQNITPQSFVRWIPGARGWFERASTRRFQSMAQGVSQEEGRLLSEYIVATMDMPSSTESSATVCFEPFLRPTEVSGGTIKQRLSALRLPVVLVYGDRDWMDRAAPHEVPNCRILTLPDSGHHLYLDNPEGLTTLMLDHL